MTSHKLNCILKNGGFIIIISLFIFNTGCKKEIKKEQATDDNFLQTYPDKLDQQVVYTLPTNDGGFLLLCTVDHPIPMFYKICTLIKTNAMGKIEWRNTLKDTIYDPQVTQLDDGSLLLGGANYFGYLMKISANGEIVFKNKYYDGGGFLMSNPIRGDNGGYFIGLTNGGFQGGPSTNVIETFDPAGNELKYYILPDDSFGGKIQVFKVFRQINPNIFYIYGSLLPFPWKWSDNSRFFAARIEITNDVITKHKIVILDKDNILFKNNLSRTTSNFIKTTDNDLIFVCFQQDYNGTDVGYISKINSDLIQVWDFRFSIGLNGTQPRSICLCEDGNYLITGACLNQGSYNKQPFACKISPGGKIIWQKIYPMPLASMFNSGKQLSDGSYIFGGMTTSFGDGINSEDMFILKTDKNGNLK